MADVTPLERANILLCEGRTKKALEIYTEILTDIDPGHPAAFLNRALCYLVLDLPELAAIDSQRALIASLYAEMGETNNVHARQIYSYAELCLLAKHKHAKWTRIPTFLRMPRLATYPGRLTIDVEKYSYPGCPSVSLQANLGRLSISQRASLRPRTKEPDGFIHPTHDAKCKALYRLVFSLAKCGGGAIKSALDMNDAGLGAACWADDLRQLNKLGNDIMFDIESMFTSEDALVSHTPSGLRALLETRCVPRDMRNKMRRDDVDLARVQRLNEIIRCNFDAHAKIAIIKPETSAGFTLVAKEDIRPSDIIFTEATTLYVSTANAGDGINYCDACYARLDTPEELWDRIYHVKTKEPASPSLRSPDEDLSSLNVDEHIKSPVLDESRIAAKEAIQIANWMAEGFPETPVKFDQHPANALSPRGSRYSSPDNLPDADLHICTACNGDVHYCSSNCHKRAMRMHHAHLCNRNGLKKYMAQTHLDKDHADIPPFHVRLLQTLLLMKLLSWAGEELIDPLDLSAIKLLDACDIPGVPPADGSEQKCVVAWSYLSHVVLPLQLLQAIDGFPTKPDSVLQLQRSDGLVINKLLYLIGTHMRVSSTWRWTIAYDADGKIISTTSADDADNSSPESSSPSSSSGFTRAPNAAQQTSFTSSAPSSFGEVKERKTIWHASLHPLCSLLSVASDVSDANVELVGFSGGRVLCLPLAARREAAKKENSKVSSFSRMTLNSTPPSPIGRVTPMDEDQVVCITEGTPLILASREIRSATQAELAVYKAEDDSGIEEGSEEADVADTMMTFEGDDGNMACEEEENSGMVGYEDEDKMLDDATMEMEEGEIMDED